MIFYIENGIPALAGIVNSHNCSITFMISGAPSFVLGLIPTDNKFTAVTVKNRWNYIRNEFKKLGVNVISFASDGDSKYFATMKSNLKFGTINHIFGHPCPVDMSVKEIYVQDPPHTIKNFKNKFCDLAANLKMGTNYVTVNHLLILIQLVPKNKHLLNEYNILNQDKMDYSMIYRISTENVVELLEKHVNNSIGTVEFLRMLRFLLEAFVEKNVPVLVRLFNAFYCVFLLRFWRSFCILSEVTNLTENFITSDAYFATELNTFMLLKLVVTCRDEIGKEFFLVWLMNSQICERLFRILRSNTTTLSTVVNFSTLEMLERIRKIQLQQELINDLKNDFTFPTNLVSDSINSLQEDMPTDGEIQKTIDDAFEKAKEVSKKLGIFIRDHQYQEVQMYPSPENYSISTNSANLIDIKEEKDQQNSSNPTFDFQNMKFIDETSGKNICNLFILLFSSFPSYFQIRMK